MIEDIYPLSPLQEGLYYHWLSSPQSPAYFMQMSYQVKGKLEMDILERSYETLVARHAVLRTSFTQDYGDRLLQIVKKEPNPVFEYLDVSGDGTFSVEDYKLSDRSRGFDLHSGSQMRLTVLKLDKDTYDFIWSHHHILMDGWCVSILIKEFFQIYHSLVQGKTPELNEVYAYSEYIKWLMKVDKEESLSYWKEYLSGYHTVSGIPGTSAKIKPGFQARQKIVQITGPSRQTLRDLCVRIGTTENTFIQAMWGILLDRYNNTGDVVFGSVVSGRPGELEGVEEMIGMFANTIPVRIRIRKDAPVKDLLKEVQQTFVGSGEYQYVQLAEIQAGTSLGRNLFDHILVFENYPVQEVVAQGIDEQREGGGLSLLSFSGFDRSNYDFSVTVIPGDPFTIRFNYNGNLYDDAQIELVQQNLLKVIRQVLEDPMKKVGDLDYLSEQEKHRLLDVFNDTAENYPDGCTLVDLFEKQAEKTPGAIAVVFEGAALTYKELDQQSNQLAHHLKANFNIQPDDVIGIVMDRSEKMITAILGILRSGGAYVPIDPDYPKARKALIVLETKMKALITRTEHIFDLDYYDGGVLAIDIPLETGEIPSGSRAAAVTPRDLAYVIYTSGSTGRPKGVMIEHGTIVNTILSQREIFDINEGERGLQFASASFDASVSEIFTILTAGGTLYIVNEEKKKDPSLLQEYISDNGIDIATIPPAYLKLMDIEKVRTLKKLITAGEQAIPEQAASFLQHGVYYNAYGPTESSICASIFKVNRGVQAPDRNIPIGAPIANTQLYIVDDQGALMPIGAIGEICIGGAGLARGYWHNPDLTAEKFIADPFRENGRIYRTGDLGRWLPDGNVEFAGRKDDQVKIHGYRIEPGEIESVIQSHPDIDAALVLARETGDGDKMLVAYMISSDGLTIPDLRSFLGNRLPAYMVPTHYVRMETLPMNVNGKIDRQQLPDPEGAGMSPATVYIAPQNELHRHLVEIYEEVLKKERIGIKDDFFVLGGDSIKSIQIVSRLKQRGYTVAIQDIMLYPVVEDLAKQVLVSSRSIEQGVVEGAVPLGPIQKYFFERHPGQKNHYNQAVLLRSEAPVSEEGLRSALEKITYHHDALRMVYRQTPEGWVQENKRETQGYSLTVTERGDDASFIAKCDQIQSGIDLENGPLLKAGLFRGTEGDDILLVVHHLVIDGVSWRILLEDLSGLYRQYLAGEPLNLPLKTDSFSYWQHRQMDYALSEDLEKEEPYWSGIESLSFPSLSLDNPEGTNLIEDTASCSFVLDEPATERLLTRCYKAYRTEINDILLTAVSLSLKKVFGLEKVLVNIEGHGREHIGADIDVSRTIGWFTSLYPMAFDMRYSGDPIRQLIEVKEHLHRVPNKGIGYGILRYLAGKSYRLDPQITFNYLGNFDSTGGAKKEKDLFDFSGDYYGRSSSGEMERDSVLNFSGIVVQGRMRLSIGYSDKQYDETTMERLMTVYRQQVEELAGLLSAEKQERLTPVDLTYQGLSVDQVAGINENGNLEDVYPLSPLQHGLYYHWLSSPGSPTYFIQVSYRVRGDINAGILEQSYKALVDRHAVLRTSFTQEFGNIILQVVKRKVAPDFVYMEVTGDKDSFVKDFREFDRSKGFDLHSGSQMRLAVLGLGDDTFEFVWSHHHIIMDGWCGSILIKEFFQIYYSLIQGKPVDLGQVYPYSRYIEWLGMLDNKQALAYWKKYLTGYDGTGALPRPAARSNQGYLAREMSFILEGDERASIRNLCVESGVTENTFFQTVWGILIGKYNNTTDVVFGSVVSGRPAELEGIEETIGLFINTIPVRINGVEGMTARELLKQVQQESIEGSKHHYIQLAEILSESAAGRNLFDHILVFENYPVQEIVKQGMEGDGNDNGLPLLSFNSFDRSNYDFTFTVIPNERIIIKFDYNGNIYEEGRIRALQHHLTGIIDQVLKDPGRRIEEIDYMDENERHELLMDFNDIPAAEYDHDIPVPGLFEAQAMRTPDNTAVMYDNAFLTYQELNEKADRLAWYLKNDCNVQSNDRIGIMLDRSDKMIVAILGILKSGAAYVPIDPGYPTSRKEFILQDTSAKVLITQSEYFLDLDYYQGTVFAIDIQLDTLVAAADPTGVAIDSDDLAYIIYTSGSTGQPKGCSITHRNLSNYIQWACGHYFETSGRPNFGLFTSLSFDLTVTSIFCPLTQGGQLRIYPSWQPLTGILEHIFSEESGINAIKLTPAHINMLEHLDITSPTIMNAIVGGEQMTQRQVRILKNINSLMTVYNEYGPTETTVGCIVARLDANEPIRIGKPISNVYAYILDNRKKPCPIGIMGEIYVGGVGVGRGYQNNLPLTSEKFVANPFREGDRLYRTGDQGRWLSDGNIEFTGRKDDQVKVHGYRIELGEIESALQSHPEVVSTVVIARPDKEGGKELVAYLVANQPLSISGIRAYLDKVLPIYMMPSHFVQLEALPLTPNGKIDRRQLPDPEGMGMSTGTAYQPPRNVLEEKMIAVWQDLLGREEIGITDNFFDVGGNSIKIILLSRALTKELERDISIALLFQYPNIGDLSDYIMNELGTSEKEIFDKNDLIEVYNKFNL